MTPHKITLEEYHQMAPIFPDARLELIEGELFDMAPIGIAHFWAVAQLTNLLAVHLKGKAFTVCQGPLSLSDSEPEPDVMVAKLSDYRQRLPKPTDVFWLIEVADSSLSYDRTRKLPLYARNGVPEVWLIDLNARIAEVHRQPMGDRYHNVTTPKILTPLAFPELTIALEDILP